MGAKDLSGSRFGKLVAVEDVGVGSTGSRLWKCQCDCGETKVVAANRLVTGHTKSCGCGRNVSHLEGRTFGRLCVLEKSGRSEKGSVIYKCLCTCGSIVFVKSHLLKNGGVRSCGCLKRESTIKNNRLRLVAVSHVTHGGTGTRLYSIWRGMKNRCYRKSNQAYPHYGGRGIFICDDWLNDFAVFRKWALANGYENNLTIDRINNDDGYCPENCRWVTMKVQARNRRNTK